jgi:glycosyltransferase involved in cell wall biosynthesis
MPSFSIVTVCKGRLHHLKQTLPIFIALCAEEVIVVDYGCPQNTGDWVESNFPAVKVVRVTDDAGFCLSRGRNFGAGQSSSSWLLFADADIKIEASLIDWARANCEKNYFYRSSVGSGDTRDPNTYGTFLCERDAFDRIGGFDEVFRGWGGEDDDIYERLVLSGSREGSFPSDFLSAIRHDDRERVAFHAVKDKVGQHFRNRFYRTLKMQAMNFYRIKMELPLEMRQKIHRQVEAAFDEWGA